MKKYFGRTYFYWILLIFFFISTLIFTFHPIIYMICSIILFLVFFLQLDNYYTTLPETVFYAFAMILSFIIFINFSYLFENIKFYSFG